MPLLCGGVHGGLGAIEGGAGGAGGVACVDEGAEGVVAEPLANGGEGLDQGDGEFGELVGRANARVHQDARGVERAGGEDDFLGGEVLFPVGLDADGLLAIEQDALDGGVGEDGEVLGARLEDVLRHGAPAVVRRADQQRHADRVARVVVRVQLVPGLFEGFEHRDQVGLALDGKPDVERAGRAMVLRPGRSKLARDVLRECAVEVLERLEAPLDGLPAESVVAHDARPLVVVVAGADGEDAKVDAGRAAEAEAPVVAEHAVAAVRLGHRLVAPVDVLLQEGCPALAVDPQLRVRVVATGLEEEDLGLLGRVNEPVGERAARWSACLERVVTGCLRGKQTLLRGHLLPTITKS